MAQVAVSIEGIGKRYRITHQREPYGRLTESLASALRRPFRRAAAEEFWALRDVTFDVTRGDVVGIIGRNGAGKSTLLKILSRITEPTEGRAVLRGRVGSLLEVGTGFHPELSGRENIFLSGSILGMRRSDIRRKFDEIVAFAGIDRFLDTPVKRYSSGMQVRLGFAVAAHLEPEILVVDEVLAVGDAAFQRKSLAKMEDVARGGRTVLFVSHNMAAVESLCTSAVLLAGGTVATLGDTASVVSAYLAEVGRHSGELIASRTDRQGDGRLRFTSIAAELRTGGRSVIRLAYEATAEHSQVEVSIGIFTLRGEGVAYLSTSLSGAVLGSIPPKGVLCCTLEPTQILPGTYTVNVYSAIAGTVADWVQEAASLTVAEGDAFGTGRLPPAGYGHSIAPHSWIVERD